MYVNTVFELSMVLDHERFHEPLSRVHKGDGYLEEYGGNISTIR